MICDGTLFLKRDLLPMYLFRHLNSEYNIIIREDFKHQRANEMIYFLNNVV